MGQNNSNSNKLSYRYKFTVVITSYNKGKWLKEAINSVLSQTLQNVQLIVVDDCSDDPYTVKVLNEISNDVYLIKLDKNRGVSAARNKGIRNADSEYICCLDGDDYLEPTYLEKARNIFENDKDVGIVTTFYNEFGDITGKRSFSEDDMSLAKIVKYCYIISPSCFRREASVKVGMYDENLKMHEDWEHWINIVKDGWKIKIIPEYLINRRRILKNSLYFSNVSKSDIYYSYIVNKHRKLYEEHLVDIMTTKHLQAGNFMVWFKNLETQHKGLEAQYKNLEAQHKRLQSFLLFRIMSWVWFNLFKRFIPEGLQKLIYRLLFGYQ